MWELPVWLVCVGGILALVGVAFIILLIFFFFIFGEHGEHKKMEDLK